MMRAEGGRIEVADAMTLACATELFAAGKALVAEAGAETVFDLSQVTDVDSSALAVIFGWLREAERQGKRLTIAHAPRDLLSLADVYGVSDLLPLAA